MKNVVVLDRPLTPPREEGRVSLEAIERAVMRPFASQRLRGD